VQQKITGAGYANRLSAGVVLTGGAAAMPGMADLANDVFGIGVRIGVPHDHITGLIDSVEAPRFATVTGLALYGAHRLALGGVAGRVRRAGLGAPGMDKWIERVRVWLQDFF
jgi:cell division protein FtsA